MGLGAAPQGQKIRRSEDQKDKDQKTKRSKISGFKMENRAF
jgi:hypothetical protein